MLLYYVRVFLYSFIAASAINVSFPILLLFSSFLSLLPLSPLLPLSSNPPRSPSPFFSLPPPSSSLPLLRPTGTCRTWASKHRWAPASDLKIGLYDHINLLTWASKHRWLLPVTRWLHNVHDKCDGTAAASPASLCQCVNASSLRRCLASQIIDYWFLLCSPISSILL